jgi:hypothetical protein
MVNAISSRKQKSPARRENKGYTLDEIKAVKTADVDALLSFLVLTGQKTLTTREIFEVAGSVESTLHALITLAMSARQRRLFASDCAERALSLARSLGLEPDPRSWSAVEATRRFAEGELSIPEIRASAESARQAAEYVCHRLASIPVPRVACNASASWAARAASRSAYYTDDLTADWASALHNACDAAEAALKASSAPEVELKWQIERVLWYTEGEAKP